MHTPVNGGVLIGSHFNKNAYMHEQTAIQFGVRLVDRKNLNWCTTFSGVSLCSMQNLKVAHQGMPWNPSL